MKVHYEGLDVAGVVVERQADENALIFSPHAVQERVELRRKGEDDVLVKEVVAGSGVIVNKGEDTLVIRKNDENVVENDVVDIEAANKTVDTKTAVVAKEPAMQQQQSVSSSEAVKLMLKQRQDVKESEDFMKRLQLTNQLMLVQELNTKVSYRAFLFSFILFFFMFFFIVFCTYFYFCRADFFNLIFILKVIS